VFGNVLVQNHQIFYFIIYTYVFCIVILTSIYQPLSIHSKHIIIIIYISGGDPEKFHILRMIDYFYYKEHLFLVTELLKDNLYEYSRYIRHSGAEPYFTIPRLKSVMRQLLEAVAYIHSLNLIHCDIKPENILIQSYSQV
jgi:serine/threonine protein kinase